MQALLRLLPCALPSPSPPGCSLGTLGVYVYPLQLEAFLTVAMLTPAFQSRGPHCLLRGNIPLALVFGLTFLSLTASDFFTRMLRLLTEPCQPVQVVRLVLSSSQRLNDRDSRHSQWQYGKSLSLFIIAVSSPDTPPPQPANLPHTPKLPPQLRHLNLPLNRQRPRFHLPQSKSCSHDYRRLRMPPLATPTSSTSSIHSSLSMTASSMTLI